jgi:hypothetical protein
MQVQVIAGPTQVVSRDNVRLQVREHWSGRTFEGFAVWNEAANVQVSDLYGTEQQCLDFMSKSRNIFEY